MGGPAPLSRDQALQTMALRTQGLQQRQEVQAGLLEDFQSNRSVMETYNLYTLFSSEDTQLGRDVSRAVEVTQSDVQALSRSLENCRQGNNQACDEWKEGYKKADHLVAGVGDRIGSYQSKVQLGQLGNQVIAGVGVGILTGGIGAAAVATAVATGAGDELTRENPDYGTAGQHAALTVFTLGAFKYANVADKVIRNGSKMVKVGAILTPLAVNAIASGHSDDALAEAAKTNK